MGFHINRRLHIWCAWSLSAVAAVGVGSGAVQADAAIEISATPTSEPTFVFEDRSFDVVVSNPGTEQLSSLVVTAGLEGPPFPDTVLTDRVVVVGNDDGLLDPGEQWSFQAIVPAGESTEFNVTAMAPDNSTVSGFFLGAGPPLDSLVFPVELSVAPDVTTAVAGAQVRWTVSGTNLAAFPVVGVEGNWRLLYPNWSAPIGLTPLGAPTERGDGDDVLSPGERWRWQVDTIVTVDESFLEVDLSAERGDLGGSFRLGVVQDSAPLSVGPASTTPASTTPAAGLPATGVDRTLVLAALCFVLLGAAAVTIARSSFTVRTRFPSE